MVHYLTVVLRAIAPCRPPQFRDWIRDGMERSFQINDYRIWSGWTVLLQRKRAPAMSRAWLDAGMFRESDCRRQYPYFPSTRMTIPPNRLRTGTNLNT